MKFFAKANGKRGEIYLYEAIGEGWFGGITAKSFSDSIKELGSVNALDIYINSPGGSVFDGIAIYNQIKRHSAAERWFTSMASRRPLHRSSPCRGLRFALPTTACS